MQAYARWLFGIAGGFNFLVAAGLLFFRPQLGPVLELDPVSGSNVLLCNLAAALVAVFGYAYWQAARDPATYRPYIVLGVIGKLTAVAVTAVAWLNGDIGWRLPLLVGGDLAFAALFFDFLRRSRTG